MSTFQHNVKELLGFGTQLWGLAPEQLTIRVDNPVGLGVLREGMQFQRLSARPSQFVLRPALGRDHARVDRVRRANHRWLGPWEATIPPGSSEQIPDFDSYVRDLDRRQRDGQALSMVSEVDGQIAGIVTVSSVQRQAMSQGVVGYWVTEDAAHRGVASLSVAILIDLVIGELGLHRLEVNVRPENTRSLGLCHKLGLREEGLKVRFMNIAGQWADHVAFAIDTEDWPDGGLVRRVWGVDVF